VADTWSNPANTVIGDRAYSDDFEQAAELVAAAVEGFHEGGVACTLKHFPGHGDSSTDSHYGSVVIRKTLDELRAGELLPFKAGIDAGADAVMVGHLIVSDVSEEPASFSYELVTGLLRQELGFNGVVMTDGLEMKAMADHYGIETIAVRVVQAGVDILLGPAEPEKAVQALLNAVESGELTEERINESVGRILTMKERWGILN
jgi:beta-N-acetylhexosaminidase